LRLAPARRRGTIWRPVSSPRAACGPRAAPGSLSGPERYPGGSVGTSVRGTRRAARDQRLDLGWGKPNLGEDFACVLTQPRRMAPVFRLRLGPFRSHGHRFEASFARVLHGAEIADGLEVRVGHDVVEAVHALHRDVGAFERLDP